MAETRRKFDADFKQGAVRLVGETGRPIAQVAKDPGINEGTPGNWVNADKRRRGEALGNQEDHVVGGIGERFGSPGSHGPGPGRHRPGPATGGPSVGGEPAARAATGHLAQDRVRLDPQPGGHLLPVPESCGPAAGKHAQDEWL